MMAWKLFAFLIIYGFCLVMIAPHPARQKTDTVMDFEPKRSIAETNLAQKKKDDSSKTRNSKLEEPRLQIDSVEEKTEQNKTHTAHKKTINSLIIEPVSAQ